MSARITRGAAVVGAVALAFSTATGVTHAQESDLLPGGDLGSVDLQPLLEDVPGLLPPSESPSSESTTGSADAGTGSLSGSAGAGTDSADVTDPAPGTGSVDTSGSALVGEPTAGSLTDVVTDVAGSLGTGQGVTTVTGTTGSNSLAPLALAGGSLSGVAVGIQFAPEIQQELAADVELPPLPRQ